MFGSLSLLPNGLDWLFPGQGNPETARAYPALALWEDADRLHLEAELPGFRIEDLEVAVLGDELTIKGERKPEPKEGWTCHRSERVHGTFLRTLTLPVAVDPEAVTATLKDGILSVELPKRTEAKPRRIEVKRLEKR